MNTTTSAELAYLCRTLLQVIKKDCAGEDEMDKKRKPKQPAGNKREVKSEDATSQVSPEIAIGNNSSNLGL